jgi:hypothetical protein
MFKQAQEAMRRLDARHNHPSDHRTDQAAAALTAQSYLEGLRQIKRIEAATDGSRLVAIDDTLGPVLRKLADLPTMEALDAPIAQSTQAYEQAVRQSEQQALERAMQQNLQQQHQTPDSDRAMAR